MHDPVHASLRSPSGKRLEFGDFEVAPGAIGRPHDGATDRMLRARLHCSRNGEDLLPVQIGHGHDIGDLGPPMSQRARLVERHHPNVGHSLETGPTFDEYTLPGRAGDGTHDGHGGRDDQGAGTCDHEEGEPPKQPG